VADYESILRDGYAKFAKGDLQGYLDLCADDFVFHAPGNNKMTGDYTKANFTKIIDTLMAVTGGNFTEDVHDVLVNNDHGVVLARHTVRRSDGAEHAFDVAHVYHLQDAKLAECWECPADPTTFDRAWA
jgi:ketosteroid isomerase-like protein